MNVPKWKVIVKKYGLLFAGVYIITFFVLVTVNANVDLPTFAGDISFGKSFYLPFGSSAAFAFFSVVMFEAYNLFKHS